MIIFLASERYSYIKHALCRFLQTERLPVHGMETREQGSSGGDDVFNCGRFKNRTKEEQNHKKSKGIIRLLNRIGR
jgi:hypothetical protein